MTREQRSHLDATLRNAPLLSSTSIEAQRAGFAAFMATMPIPDGILTSETELAEMRTLRVDPVDDVRAGTILYLHGGAYIVGSPETGLGLAANLVMRTGRRSLVPDYRLAPEHPFPAGPADAFAAYRALLDAGEDSSSIVLAGDSAGGGLAVVALLQARDAGLPMPAAAVLFSPGLDKTSTGASMVSRAAFDPIFTRESLEANGRSTLPAPIRTSRF